MKYLFVFIAFLFFQIPAFGNSIENTNPPIADFTFENACIFESAMFTDLSQGNVTAWEWNFDGTGTSDEQDPEYTFTGNGTFNVRLVVFNDCGSDTISKSVVIQSLAPTYIDTVVCNGEPFYFNGESYTEYVQFPEPVFLEETFASSQGCDSIVILRAQINPCGCEITFPNVFTPNEDGVNDKFQPYIVCDQIIRDYRMIIYDRWGETVFETFEYKDSWDGTINGFPMATGVFVYWVQYEIVEGDNALSFKEAKDVTLIR